MLAVKFGGWGGGCVFIVVFLCLSIFTYASIYNYVWRCGPFLTLIDLSTGENGKSTMNFYHFKMIFFNDLMA